MVCGVSGLTGTHARLPVTMVCKQGTECVPGQNQSMARTAPKLRQRHRFVDQLHVQVMFADLPKYDRWTVLSLSFGQVQLMSRDIKSIFVFIFISFVFSMKFV